MKPKPLDLEEIDEEIIEELNKRQPHDLQTEIDVFKEVIRKRIKSACDFFLRYKGNPSLLIIERPEFREEVENMFLDRYSTAKYGVNVWRLEQYNEWLFKLAFKDVFEGEQR